MRILIIIISAWRIQETFEDIYISENGEGNGNPLQYSCLKIPWAEKPGGLQSTGWQRVSHDWTRMHTHTHSAHEANAEVHFARLVLTLVLLFMGQRTNLCLLGKRTKNDAKWCQAWEEPEIVENVLIVRRKLSDLDTERSVITTCKLSQAVKCVCSRKDFLILSCFHN